MTRVAVELFQCTKLGVKLTRAACGEHHSEAVRTGGIARTNRNADGSARTGNTYQPCRTCPIGEVHAGGDPHPDAPAINVPVADLVGRGHREKLRLVPLAGIEPADEPDGGDGDGVANGPRKLRCIECGRDGHDWESCPRLSRAKIVAAIERAEGKAPPAGMAPVPAGMAPVHTSATASLRPTETAVEVKAPAVPAAAKPRTSVRAPIALPASALPARAVATPLVVMLDEDDFDDGDPPAAVTATATTATGRTAMETKKACRLCFKEFEPPRKTSQLCGNHSPTEKAKFYDDTRAERMGGGAGATPVKTKAQSGAVKKKATRSGNAVAKAIAASTANGNGHPARAADAAPTTPSSPREALELLGFRVEREIAVPKGRLLLVADGPGGEG